MVSHKSKSFILLLFIINKIWLQVRHDRDFLKSLWIGDVLGDDQPPLFHFLLIFTENIFKSLPCAITVPFNGFL